MSGFKVIGVVLGSSPLLISALEHYDTDYVALCKGDAFSSHSARHRADYVKEHL